MMKNVAMIAVNMVNVTKAVATRQTAQGQSLTIGVRVLIGGQAKTVSRVCVTVVHAITGASAPNTRATIGAHALMARRSASGVKSSATSPSAFLRAAGWR